jgi:4-hydroxybenzoate polyprenyltransferase
MATKTRVRSTILDLVRLPNVFTAAADAVAGFLYVGGGIEDWPTLLALVGASSCLYSGGVVLNDVCDVKRDALERPKRPIPSGRISRQAASVLAAILLAAGVGCAACVSTRAFVIAGLLVLAIILYDAVLKTTAVAPALMGVCRALNLTLAMSWAASLGTTAIAIPAGLMWLYVTSLTFFARHEAGFSTRGRLAAGTAGMCLAITGLAALWWVLEPAHPTYLGLVAALVLFVGYHGWQAVRKAEPATVQRSTKTFVLAIILFDTCLAAASRGPLVALLVAVLILPAVLSGRLFRVT